jgi:hypothetical protein
VATGPIVLPRGLAAFVAEADRRIQVRTLAGIEEHCVEKTVALNQMETVAPDPIADQPISARN